MQALYLTFQGIEKNVLKMLLNGFDFSEFHFDVSRLETKKDFFIHPDWEYLEQPTAISSEQAKKRILQDDDEHACIENLALYIRNKSTRKKRIQTFKDLVDGHYDLALKVVGKNNIEFFSTNESVLKKIMMNAEGLNEPYKTIKPYERIDFSTVLGM